MKIILIVHLILIVAPFGRLDDAMNKQWNNVQFGATTVQDIKNEFGQPDEVIDSMNYASLENALYMSYDNPSVEFFFVVGKVVLIRVEADAESQYPLTRLDWQETVGSPNKILASKRGKNSRIMVYDKEGLAASFDDYGNLLTVDLFKPNSSKPYEELFYEKPPVFVK